MSRPSTPDTYVPASPGPETAVHLCSPASQPSDVWAAADPKENTPPGYKGPQPGEPADFPSKPTPASATQLGPSLLQSEISHSHLLHVSCTMSLFLLSSLWVEFCVGVGGELGIFYFSACSS